MPVNTCAFTQYLTTFELEFACDAAALLVSKLNYMRATWARLAGPCDYNVFIRPQQGFNEEWNLLEIEFVKKV